MADKKPPVDQDALAAEWGMSLEGDGAGEGDAAAAAGGANDDMAAEWAAMIDDGGGFAQVAKGGADRILHQDEIDSLLGFNIDDVALSDNSGIRAIIDSGVVSYERLPMLEIIFDRLVRLTTSSLRQFTSDNVEVSLDRITSVRFGDYLNSIPLPAILAVFKAEQWDNYGLFTVDSNLIYSMIDVLLGGRRAPSAVRIDMEDRGGSVELLLPYATIEPIRDVLLQMFMGEKFGRDPIWEGHLATEIGQAEIAVDAVLYEAKLPLRRMMALQVGDTLPLELGPDALVTMRCGEVALTEGRMGRVGDRVAVRVVKPLRKPSTTFAMFETAGSKCSRPTSRRSRR